MTPPDSGEREVPCTCGSTNNVHRIECATLAYLRAPPTPYAGPPPMPDGWIAVSRPLARRILAALEDIDTQEARAIRSELRARMPR